jgi:hypothetical protein
MDRAAPSVTSGIRVRYPTGPAPIGNRPGAGARNGAVQVIESGDFQNIVSVVGHRLSAVVIH